MRVVITLLFALALSMAGLLPAEAQRSMPGDNIGYPVLITFPNGTGSGFYFHQNNAMFLVTAKHVLFDLEGTKKPRQGTAKLLSYSKEPSNMEANQIILDLDELQRSGLIKAHDSQDVAVVKILTAETTAPNSYIGTPLRGVIVSDKNPGIVSVGPDSIKTLDQVLVGNEVIVFGYPTSLGLQNKPQLDPLHPVLRKGIVAGLNMQRKAIVLDCPVYYGNSGGPVIQIDPISAFERRFSVIGVVGEFVPFVEQTQTSLRLNNSGYSIAAPIDAVIDLIKSM